MTSKDLISRQQAIGAVDSETVSTNLEHFKSSEKFIKFMNDADVASFGKWQWANGFNTALVATKIQLEKLPPAQPEIIRCTECKHYREYDSKYVENAVVVQCMADRYPISETIPDGWFCAGAERKDDE